jgi:hypothetical protein
MILKNKQKKKSLGRLPLKTIIGVTFLCAANVFAQGNVTDCEGYLWDFAYNGMVNDGGNDTFDGGIRLRIQNTEVNFQGRRMPAAVGGRRFVLGPTQTPGFNNVQLTRKIFVPEKMACAIYLEIFENSSNAPVEINNIGIFTDLGGGGSAVQAPVKHGGISWAVADNGGGQRNAVAQRFCDDGSRFRVTYVLQGDQLTVQFLSPLKLKPQSRTGILHVVAQRRDPKTAEAFVKKLKFSALLKELDPDDRKFLANVSGGEGLLKMGDLELFRGERGDAILLTSGELLSGRLLTETLTFDGEFGSRTFSAKEMLSLFGISGGLHRAILESGEVLSGKPSEPNLRFRLSNRTELNVPLRLIARYGRQLPTVKEPKAGAEEEETAPSEQFIFTDPVFILRDGDRLVGKLSVPKLTVRALYGEIPLSVGALRAVHFPNREIRTPIFETLDGCVITGLPLENRLEVRPRIGKPIPLDLGRLAGIQFVAKQDDDDSSAKEVAGTADKGEEVPPETPPAVGRLKLINGDVLVGELTAPNDSFAFDTPFGTQTTGTSQIRRLRFQRHAFRAVRLTFWDGNTLPAQLPGEALAFQTSGGVKLAIPYGLLSSFSTTKALPPPEELVKVEELIKQLGDAAPENRKAAQLELTQMGPAIRGVLLKHWKHEDLEIRLRIREICKQIPETIPNEAPEDEDAEEEEK